MLCLFLVDFVRAVNAVYQLLQFRLVTAVCCCVCSCFQDGVEEVTCFTITDTISARIFRNVLDFLYSGSPNISEADLAETKQAAKLFGVSELEQICKNCEEDMDYLNPSIGTWLNDRSGSVAKQLFFGEDLMSDLTFVVDGHRVPAHCALLSARCQVLDAMLGGNFCEGRGSEVDNLNPEWCVCVCALSCSLLSFETNFFHYSDGILKFL